MKYVPKDIGDTHDNSKGDQSVKYALILVLSFVFFSICFFLLVSLFAGSIINYIPDSWEKKAFSTIEMSTASKNCETTPEFLRAKAIFEALTHQTKLRDLNFNISCYKSPDVNAFAMPGGSITLTTGLLDNINSEEGLAFVIGHEIGHHQSKHALKRIANTLFFQTAWSLLSGNSNFNSLQYLTKLQGLSYSRKQEIEADDFGFGLTRQRIKSSKNLTEFFDYIIKDQRIAKESKVSNLFSTHPMTQERIDRIQEKLKNSL